MVSHYRAIWLYAGYGSGNAFGRRCRWSVGQSNSRGGVLDMFIWLLSSRVFLSINIVACDLLLCVVLGGSVFFRSGLNKV